MTLRAIFLDFYGTVVHGDDRVVGDVCERIASVVGIPSEQIPKSELNEPRYRHWQQPPLFHDASRFLAKIDRSFAVCAVSNIDRGDIEAAAAFHGLHFDAIVTSQDARAYKPRREVFDLALDTMGISAAEALHVGDSLTSDVGGAQAIGISTVWVNRQGKEPKGLFPDYEIGSFDELPGILDSLK